MNAWPARVLWSAHRFAPCKILHTSFNWPASLTSGRRHYLLAVNTGSAGFLWFPQRSGLYGLGHLIVSQVLPNCGLRWMNFSQRCDDFLRQHPLFYR
jgi:hypothetical protein